MWVWGLNLIGLSNEATPPLEIGISNGGGPEGCPPSPVVPPTPPKNEGTKPAQQTIVAALGIQGSDPDVSTVDSRERAGGC